MRFVRQEAHSPRRKPHAKTTTTREKREGRTPQRDEKVTVLQDAGLERRCEVYGTSGTLRGAASLDDSCVRTGAASTLHGAFGGRRQPAQSGPA